LRQDTKKPKVETEGLGSRKGRAKDEVTIAELGTVSVGDTSPVRVMAAINVSPESFYKGSVAGTTEQVDASVERAIAEGADIIDIGGASTAPYLKGGVSTEVEEARVRSALREALGVLEGRSKKEKVPISVDTVRGSVADLALRNGASMINDVSGLKNDPQMATIVRDRGASLLAMAHSSRVSIGAPIEAVGRSLSSTLAIAREAGLDERCIVLDPGIGFFRDGPPTTTSSVQRVMPWYEWDCDIIANLRELRWLGRPLGVGMSRKSFLGKILGLDSPDDRLAGSLSITGIAVMNGAKLIRTHDVKQTVEAARVAEAVKARLPLGRCPV
jgi:dihydropteroate synthase